MYRVSEGDGRLVSYDENGDIVAPVNVYMNGKRVLETEEDLYHPVSVVRAAYSTYHEKQGSRVIYILSILLFAYGWCGFRYEAFQNFMFKISPERLYVREAEPSDFYFLMCKVGGIAIMLFSFYLFIKSFTY